MPEQRKVARVLFDELSFYVRLKPKLEDALTRGGARV
jgi:hypothetical protein